MLKRISFEMILIILLAGMFTSILDIQPIKSEPTTIIVPDDYSTIQQAIDAANSGDTIYVRAGTYHERVTIGSYTSGRSNLRIVGEDLYNTTVDTSSTGSAPGPFNIRNSDHITITGFTVTTVGYGAGIDLHHSDYCNITGNRILDSDWDILLQNDCHYNIISNNILLNGLQGVDLFSSWGAHPCTHNTIMNNNITAETAGIVIEEECDDNLIIGNTILSTYTGYRVGGIEIVESSDCFLRDNALAGNFSLIVWGDSVLDYIHDIDTSNRVDGKPIYYWINEHDKNVPSDAGMIYLINSTRMGIADLNFEGQTSPVNLISTSDSTIQNITAKAGGSGISLLDSSDNTIDDNTLHSNVFVGVELSSSWGSSQNNTVSQNNLTNNHYGIYLLLSSDNTLTGNDLVNNDCGVRLYDCSDNKFYHNNFVDNTQQVYIMTAGYSNVWDDEYPSGGNYWSNYTGIDSHSGPYQNETGSDGIGDSPLVIDADNVDNYPLMKTYPWDPYDIGITAITASKTVVGQGNLLLVNVMIYNYGLSAESFNVTAYANITIIGETRVTLPSLSYIDVAFPWNTTGFGKGSYTIGAEADIILGEIDTTDNTCTDGWVRVSMLGDITGPEGWPDGACDMLDVATVSRYFGQDSPPAPANYDVIYDGAIDMLDVATVARHFGETDP